MAAGTLTLASGLYAPSLVVLANRGGCFVKVDAHAAGDDVEAPDLLWLEATPDSELSDGEVLSISPATADRSLWYASLDLACNFGGWATGWSTIGTAEQVVAEVLALLDETGASS